MLHVCLPVNPKLHRGVSNRDKLWDQGEEVTISFLNGTAWQQEKVKRYAAEWLDYINLTFRFVSGRSAKVRISFTPGGSWSQVGTDALSVTHQPTMNLGWITSDVDEVDIRRTILHEFGHMIGLEHEHQSPLMEIPWDRKALFDWAKGPPNYWDEQAIQENYLDIIIGERVAATSFDPKSIMLYPIPAELTGGQMVIDWNDELSEIDKQFVSSLYPRSS